MRVGLVLDRFDRRLGGVEQWTAQLADHLLSAGCELHVVARRIAEQERRSGLSAHELPPTRSRLALADAAADRLGRLNLDVIHDMGVGWYYDLLQPHGGSRAAACRQNLAMAPPWSRPWRGALQRCLPRYRDFDKLAQKQYGALATDRPARLVVAISGMVQSDLAHFHDVDEARLRLVYNGVDIERFNPATGQRRRAEIRRAIAAENEPVFLIVAHNFALKGVPALLRAARRLKEAGQSGIIVVVGGKRPARWRARAARAGLADRVRFVGPVDDPTPFYAAADVYVQPTWYDPCSLVLLEALASGLPVVTTRFNGAAELIEPGVHGTILADPADDAALARAMREWSSPARRRMTASLCRQRAMTRSFEQNVREIRILYEEIRAARQDPARRAA